VSRVIVSDCHNHDKTSATICLDEILNKNALKEIEEIKVWTDGPSSQFKNGFIVSAIPKLAAKHL